MKQLKIAGPESDRKLYYSMSSSYADDFDNQNAVLLIELIKAAAKRTEAPTYSYLFALEFPIQHNKPAWHCSDIAFFFHNIDLVPSANVPGVSDKLQEQIFRAVMAFAHTGDPNHAELPQWDASKDGDEAVMVFDRTCECRHNFDHELLKLHEKAAPPFSFGAVENAQH